MSPSLATFLFEAANFLVLAAALGWVLFKPVRAALLAEQAQRAEAQETEAHARAESESLLDEARRRHEELEAELAVRREELLAAAQRDADAIKTAAREHEFAIEKELEQKREAAVRVQVQVLADTLGRVTAASVRALLEALPGPSLDLALIRAACERVPVLPEEALVGCTVEVARPLEPEAQKVLSETLGEAFQLRIVSDIGAGVRITTARGQVDGSALALARQAAQEIVAEATAARNEVPANGVAHG